MFVPLYFDRCVIDPVLGVKVRFDRRDGVGRCDVDRETCLQCRHPPVPGDRPGVAMTR